MKSLIAKLSVLLALGPLFGTAVYAQTGNTMEQLKDCARMADRDRRVACYEALGSRVLNADDSTPGSISDSGDQETAETEPGRHALPDDFGRDDPEKRKQPEAIEHTGLITSCKKGYDRQWYFYFDNGQVWKQVDSRPIHFTRCEFTAIISKDRVGYKMQIEGKHKRIRIKRQH